LYRSEGVSSSVSSEIRNQRAWTAAAAPVAVIFEGSDPRRKRASKETLISDTHQKYHLNDSS